MSLQSILEQLKKEYAKAAPEERDALITDVTKLGKKDLDERHQGRLVTLQNEYNKLCDDIKVFQKKRKKNRQKYNSIKSQMRLRKQTLKDKESFFSELDDECSIETLKMKPLRS